MLRKTTTKFAIAAMGIAALALTGCAAGEDAATADADAVTEETTAAEQGGAGGEGSMGGSYSLTVDGASIELEDPVVACQETGGNLSIGVASGTADADASSGLGVVLTTGDSPSVVSVGLLTADDQAVAYAEGSGMGSASVTVDGDTYQITGTGIVADIENPTSMEEAEFDFTVTCP